MSVLYKQKRTSDQAPPASSAGQFGGELQREISPWSITVCYWSIGVLYWELETSKTSLYAIHMTPPPLQIPNLNTGETC